MLKRTGYSLVILALLGGRAAATEIDLDNVPEVEILTQQSHWYGKLFVGAAMSRLSGTYLGAFETVNSHTQTKNHKTSFLAGAGVGYRFNDVWRGDFTFDYRSVEHFSFDNKAHSLVTRAPLESYVFLINGYADLLTFKNVSPYIGVGLGTAAHHFNKLQSSYTHDQLNSKIHWSVAWAATAGFGVKLSHRTVLDIAYSYSDLGDAVEWREGNGGDIALHHNVAHDIKIGVRYRFD